MVSQLRLVLKKEVPYGFCQCGCGKKSPIATRTQASRGWVAGQPKPFCDKHATRQTEIHSGGTMRRCKHCQKEKALVEFQLDRKGFLGRSTRCKACHSKIGAAYRKANPQKCADMVARCELLKKYRITLEDYNAMHQAQNGLCAICGSSQSDTVKGKPKYLAVDHDHHTGRVRGLLCGICNRGIGALGDSPDRIRKALRYLEGG